MSGKRIHQILILGLVMSCSICGAAAPTVTRVSACQCSDDSGVEVPLSYILD